MLAVLAALVAASALPSGSIAPALSSAAQESPANGEEVIVVLEDGVDPIATAQELGVEPTQISDEVFTGFAATCPRKHWRRRVPPARSSRSRPTGGCRRRPR